MTQMSSSVTNIQGVADYHSAISLNEAKLARQSSCP